MYYNLFFSYSSNLPISEGNQEKEEYMIKIYKLLLIITSLLSFNACQEDDSDDSKSSSELAAELNLVGSWLSPCTPFDGASVKKIHNFKDTGVLEVVVVEFKDKECNEQGAQIPVGSYGYSLSKKQNNVADIDIIYPDHKELGIVSTNSNTMNLVYGTDYKETRDSIDLKDLKSLKAWRKLK